MKKKRKEKKKHLISVCPAVDSAGSLESFLPITHFDSSDPVRPFSDEPTEKFKLPLQCILYLIVTVCVLHLVHSLKGVFFFFVFFWGGTNKLHYYL